MASTYSNDLRLEEQAVGENSGTWGTRLNGTVSQIADGFSYGTKAMSSDANETFTMPDGTADATRSLYLKITSSATLTATRTVTLGPNTVSKLWLVENATTGSQSIIIKQGSGATVTIASGGVRLIYTDGAGAGAAVVDAFTDLATSGTFTTAGAATFNGAITGTTATFTTADNLSQVRLISTDDDGSIGPRLDFFRNSASPAAGDFTGRMRFLAEDAAGNETAYVHFDTLISDPTDGSEDGQLRIETKLDGNMVERIGIDSTETVINEDSKSVDFRIESDSQANMFFVDASTNRVGINTSTPDTVFEIRDADPVLTIRDTETSSANGNATLRLAETGASDTLNNYWDIKADGGKLEFIDNWNEGGGTGTRLTIDDTGKLGIGTSSPGNIIEVAGASPIVEINATSGAPELQFSDGGTDEFSITYDTGANAFKVVEGGVGAHLTISDGGNVGINTTTPSYVLDVDSTIHIGQDGGSGFTHSRLIFESNGNGRGIGSFYFNQDTDLEWFAGNPYNDSDSFSITRQSTTSHAESTSNYTLGLFTIDGPTGNVGIGLGSGAPTTRLYVYENLDNAYVARFTQDHETGYGVLIDTDGTQNGDPALWIKNAANTTALWASQAGHCGIGTTAPSVPLHVVGPADTNVCIIDATGTPPNYILSVRDDNSSIFQVKRAEIVVNESSATGVDFRVESGTSTHALFFDAGQNAGILHSNGTSQTPYTQTTGAGQLAYRLDDGSAYGTLIQSNNADNGWSMMYCNKYAYSSGDDRRYIAWYVNGGSLATLQLNAAGTQVEYNTSSDRRLKDSIVDINDGITRLKQLKPRKYQWVGTDFNAEGFIADEADGIVPEAVKGEVNAVDDEGNPVYQQIEYAKYVPLLTAALQESIAKIENLESRIATLENS